jgi:uncharacterized oligopeptide transporter (OPT) family protein
LNSPDSTSRNIAWGPWIVVSLGFLLFLLGIARFILRHHFSFTDALYCVLAIIPAGFLLLIFDYVLHHAKLAAIIPLLAAGLFLFTSPVFDVSLGLTLMGAMAGPALSDWKNENRQGPHV